MRHRSTKCSKQARKWNQQKLSALGPAKMRCTRSNCLSQNDLRRWPDYFSQNGLTGCCSKPAAGSSTRINSSASPAHDHRLGGRESGDLKKTIRILPAKEDQSNPLVLPPVVAKAVRLTKR